MTTCGYPYHQEGTNHLEDNSSQEVQWERGLRTVLARYIIAVQPEHELGAVQIFCNGYTLYHMTDVHSG